jgi:hypothetical protein
MKINLYQKVNKIQMKEIICMRMPLDLDQKNKFFSIFLKR